MVTINYNVSNILNSHYFSNVMSTFSTLEMIRAEYIGKCLMELVWNSNNVTNHSNFKKAVQQFSFLMIK